ncbi:MAG: hypothetical protein JST48_08850 [Bacteroidetes bacterium]|nr:hypothetical protein [Bacteroidota bacterium]
MNPQTKGHFDKDTVKVFDTSNKSGQLTSTPSHINSYESPPCENYVCLYFGDLYYSVQYVITPFKDTEGAFIQIRPTETDTLTYEIIKGSTGFGISKIYYKGQVIWNVGISNKMTIVK